MHKVFALLLIVMMSALFTQAAHGAEEVSVYCYLGDPGDNELIGNVDVFDVSTGTALCNRVYYDCNNRCIGCYLDSDSNEVCIDPTGRQFRP